MTTVGYGDTYPESHVGRLIGVITAFWGVCFVSLFVVGLFYILNFSFSETKAYMLLLKLKAKDELKIEAVSMLTAYYKLSKMR
jgi:hypothetical protein